MQIKALPTVAIFGGSFNPVHEGHVGIVRALAEDAEVQRVVVVPTLRSPFKHGVPLLPQEVRWAMLRHALAGLPRVCLSDLEFRRPAPSYTVDTVQALAALLPSARLQFALGWDAFAEFAGWHRAAEILAVSGLLVFDRAGPYRPAPPDPTAWAALLPAPWNTRVRPQGEERLVDGQGRTLVRHLGLPLPDVAARDILSEQSLEGVPPGAREVLAAYWRQAGPG